MITSLTNETIKSLVRLHKKKGRDASRSFLIEGDHLIEEAQAAGLEFQTYGTYDSDILIADHIAEKLSQTKSGSKRFAEVKKMDAVLKDGRRFLMCDGIQDPGNLGTIVRTAHSFGFDALILSTDCVDEYNDKVVRSTQGSIFHIPIIRMNLLEAIKELQSFGVAVYSTALHKQSIGLSSLNQGKLGLVLGSEGSGVSEEVMNASHGFVKIETSQFESLNVAVAAGIICYHLREEE